LLPEVVVAVEEDVMVVAVEPVVTEVLSLVKVLVVDHLLNQD
jgi:hypothetical protein|tara:strand:- start:540 stop:665 length:126 start_codon:yes stop_codon:yes gene_type:complete